VSIWSPERAFNWYNKQDWLVGCNFLPSSAINQLEMFQQETFDLKTIHRELGWARDLGFNSLRVYLHDLLWEEKKGFTERLNIFLNVCSDYKIKPILVLFDDCHYPFPKLGKQPLPIKGVHNSGWKQSPGHRIVREINESSNSPHMHRLKKFVQEVLQMYGDDERILMWDIYNEPGQFGIGENSLRLLESVWDWSHEVRPSQPLTSCLEGSIGKKIIDLNKSKSDIITFHAYEGNKLEQIIKNLIEIGRPIMCTEYMAREYGTTFEFSLPILKKYNVGSYNWGLVAGKSQTNFNWETILQRKEKKDKGEFIKEGESLVEPDVWFHDILRRDGTPFSVSEISFIKDTLQKN